MSINISSSTWRLRAGIIPYKLMEGFPKGGIEEEAGGVEEKYIIHSKNLQAFIALSFPLGINLDEENILLTPNRRYPGSNSFVTHRLSWEPFPSNLPADPYGIDLGAPTGTYTPFITVTISYVTGKQKEDENDPLTLLEISADTAGEFLMYGLRGKAHWGKPGGDPVKEAQLPATKLIPETQWNVRWPKVNRSFLNTIIAAMRSRIGLVNSKPMTVLFNAPAETVLFAGFSYQEELTWRDGIENTPATVDMKFLERHVKQGKEVVTHNHLFREEIGKFVKIFMPNGDPPFAKTDLNNLFPPNIKVDD